MVSKTQDIDVERGTAAAPAGSESGLDENVAGALSYLFGFVSGLLFFLIEKENQFVQFHAAQSMVLSGLVIGVFVVLSLFGTILTMIMSGSMGTFLLGSIISLLLGLVWLVFALACFATWIYLLVKTYQGETTRLPVVAAIADKLV